MKKDTLLTVPEVASVIGISQITVRTAIAKGRMPAVVMYGRKLVKQSDALEYKGRTQPDGKPRTGRPRKIATTAGERP